MGADIVQAEYDQLDQIGRQFGQCAEATEELRSRLNETFQRLMQEGWEGRGSTAFSAEMNGEIFPAMQRLTQVLTDAQSVTLAIKNCLQAAEEEAAQPFHSSGEGDAVRSNGKPLNTLLVKGMQPVTNGQLFIGGSGDGRDIHPSDAKQGNLGDCFFVSSIAVVAEQHPDLIKNAIKDNGDGTYTVTFYKKTSKYWGLSESVDKVEVTVSAATPTGERVTATGTTPVAAHISSNDQDGGKQEVWSMVMENAYAKFQGGGDVQKGYAKLDGGGHTSDVLFALTGQESTVKVPQDYKLSDLARMERDGYALTLATLPSGEGGKKERYRNGTLVNGHAYYVTAVDEANGTVTIENPWGWNTNTVTIPYNELNAHFQRVTVNPLTKR